MSQVASISLEQLTGVTTVLFAPGKSTLPNVTHHRPPDVFGNDPLVQLGEGEQKGTRGGVCGIPPLLAPGVCTEPAHRA